MMPQRAVTPRAPSVASISPVPSASSVVNVSSASGASGIFSALRYRNYRLFWFGQLVSVTGTFMQGTAQQWLVLSLSSNAIALGMVGAREFGPLLVPLGGAIADRWPRRSVLMCTQAIAGSLALVLFLLTVTGMVQLWHVFVLALLLGVNNAVDMPTRQAFVSEMVPRERLLNAVSLNSAQFNASRIVGPGLAGLLIALFCTPLLFLLNAISFLAVIVGLWLMRPSELMPVTRAAAAHGLARLRALGGGARVVLATPKLRTTVLIGTAPVGNLLVSAVAGHWGVPVSFAISGIPCLLAALAAAWIWFRPGAAADAQPAASAAVSEVPARPEMATPLPGPSLAAAGDLRPTRPAYPSRLAPGKPRLPPRAAARDMP